MSEPAATDLSTAFTSVEQVLDHWRSDHPLVAGNASIKRNADEVTSATLVEGGVFMVAKFGRDWQIFHSPTGLRISDNQDRTVTKRQSVAQALQLAAMEVDGVPFDWAASDVLARLRDVPNFRELIVAARQRGNADAARIAEAQALQRAERNVVFNPAAKDGARYVDTDALRAHWLAGGPTPGEKHGDTLAFLSKKPGFSISRDGNFAVVPRGANKYELVPAGCGFRLQPNDIPIFEITGKKRVADLAKFITETIFDEQGNPLDWSDPDFKNAAAATFVSDRGEALMQVAVRVRADFDRSEGLKVSEAIDFHNRIGLGIEFPPVPEGHVHASDLAEGSVVLTPDEIMRTVTDVTDNGGLLTVTYSEGEPQKMFRNDVLRVLADDERILRDDAGERIGEKVASWEISPGDAVIIDTTGAAIDPYGQEGWDIHEHVRVQGVVPATHASGESHTGMYDTTITLLEDGVPTVVLDEHRSLRRVHIPNIVMRLDHGGRDEFRSEDTTIASLRPGDLWIENGYSYDVVGREYRGTGRWDILAKRAGSDEVETFADYDGEGRTRRVLLENRREKPVITQPDVDAPAEPAPAEPEPAEQPAPVAAPAERMDIVEVSVFDGRRRPSNVGEDQVEFPFAFLPRSAGIGL